MGSVRDWASTERPIRGEVDLAMSISDISVFVFGPTSSGPRPLVTRQEKARKTTLKIHTGTFVFGDLKKTRLEIFPGPFS